MEANAIGCLQALQRRHWVPGPTGFSFARRSLRTLARCPGGLGSTLGAVAGSIRFRMSSFEASSYEADPREGLVTLAHVIYALHAFSAVTGLIGTATVVGAFLTGWPSIIAVILNYAKRDDVRGSYLETHFSWQIRTFWYAFFWVVVGVGLMLTIVGIPIGLLIFVAISLWILCRIVRGWLSLLDSRPMPVPD